VLLPEPFGPISPTVAPRSTSRETSDSAHTSSSVDPHPLDPHSEDLPSEGQPRFQPDRTLATVSRAVL